MTVLAFDTSLGGCSVGVITPDGRSAVRQVETQRDQAKILVPLIQEAIDEAGVDFPDLKMIVTTIGPGSFTGLRIGLSTARAMGLALNIPVNGVTTLDVIAAQVKEKNLLVLLETKRQDFYAQFFGVVASEPFAASADEIIAQMHDEKLSLAGDALKRFQAEAGEEWARSHVETVHDLILPDPLVLAKLGQTAGQAPEPLYLRGADVTQAKTPPKVIEGCPIQ